MLNPMDMTGRTVLVTGASSGIGRETAVLLSRIGAHVVIAGRDGERLRQTESMLDGTGHRAEIFDLACVDDIPPWVKSITDAVGPLDGVFHSAGVQVTRPLRLLTAEKVDAILRVNVTSALGLARGFSARGCHASRASLVLMGSVMGLVGQAGIAAYSASKGAVIAMTRSLAMELARDGIRVNCIVPAHVRTEMADRLEQSLTPDQFAAIEAMHPLGIGTALDVAYAAAFLLADTGRWITGTSLVVDGGYTAR